MEPHGNLGNPWDPMGSHGIPGLPRIPWDPTGSHGWVGRGAGRATHDPPRPTYENDENDNDDGNDENENDDNENDDGITATPPSITHARRD